jgi:cell division FtsZ-interacting protein ZapD
MALCCWRKMAKNGAFQKKFERKKLAKMALLKRRTGFPQISVPEKNLRFLQVRWDPKQNQL